MVQKLRPLETKGQEDGQGFIQLPLVDEMKFLKLIELFSKVLTGAYSSDKDKWQAMIL